MRELDAALLDGAVDCAVHSAKDVPAQLPEGIVIAAVPPRADPRDALCGAADAGRAGAGRARRDVVAAARPPSCARCATISRWSSCAATSTPACASSPTATTTRSCWPPPGCERLGRGDAGTPLDELVPAAGQGCLAVTTRAGEEPLVAAIDDAGVGAGAGRRARAGARAGGRLPHAGGRARAGRSGRRAHAARVRRGRRRQRLGARRARRRRTPSGWAPAVAQRLLSAGAREVLAS